MPITVRLCTLILVTTNCIASLALGYDEALLRDEERTRRSLPGAIADILRTAKPVMKMKNYGIYERKGGYSAASADFILMRPTDVRLSGNTMFGKVEGRNVMLYRLGENTRMNIWTNKKLTDDTEAWLRINYID